MIRTLSIGAVLVAAGTAAAQRPVPTVSPPILNPQVQQYIAPTWSRYVPPRYTPPAVGYNPWVGPVVFPGTYTPPRVVQSVPGRYLNVAGLGMYNPYTGTIYSPYTDTFTSGNSVYSFNPWTGTYTNPWNGGSYNPWRGTYTQPVWNPSWASPWGW